MHPLGCFGSSLAFAPKSTICGTCAARTECQQLVDNRRPLFLRLLDRFLDAQGKPMSLPWLSAAEKKAQRDEQRAAEKASKEAQVFGDADAVMALKTHLDLRAHPVINKFVRLRLNPMKAPIETVGAVTRPLAVVIQALRSRPHTMRELTSAVATACGYSAQNAQRETYATVSILTACGRAQLRDQLLELK